MSEMTSWMLLSMMAASPAKVGMVKVRSEVDAAVVKRFQWEGASGVAPVLIVEVSFSDLFAVKMAAAPGEFGAVHACLVSSAPRLHTHGEWRDQVFVPGPGFVPLAVSWWMTGPEREAGFMAAARQLLELESGANALTLSRSNLDLLKLEADVANAANRVRVFKGEIRRSLHEARDLACKIRLAKLAEASARRSKKK